MCVFRVFLVASCCDSNYYLEFVNYGNTEKKKMPTDSLSRMFSSVIVQYYSVPTSHWLSRTQENLPNPSFIGGTGIPGFPIEFDCKYVQISKKQLKDFHLNFATKMYLKTKKTACARTESNETSAPEFNIILITQSL